MLAGSRSSSKQKEDYFMHTGPNFIFDPRVTEMPPAFGGCLKMGVWGGVLIGAGAGSVAVRPGHDIAARGRIIRANINETPVFIGVPEEIRTLVVAVKGLFMHLAAVCMKRQDSRFPCIGAVFIVIDLRHSLQQIAEDTCSIVTTPLPDFRLCSPFERI
jgi:hypothetical protein